MKILPREHGATVIWFVSILASVLTIPFVPSISRISIFFIVSAVILMLTSYITNVAPILIKIRRNQIILPIISGGLTLITPLGHFIMFGTVNETIFSVWVFLLTYTIFSVFFIQKKIKSLIQRKENSSLLLFLFSIIIFGFESSMFFLLGWVQLSIFLIILPVVIMWFFLKDQQIINKLSKSNNQIIKSIGLFQTINMIFFVVLLTFLIKYFL